MGLLWLTFILSYLIWGNKKPLLLLGLWPVAIHTDMEGHKPNKNSGYVGFVGLPQPLNC